jgi:hypothetical protein
MIHKRHQRPFALEHEDSPEAPQRRLPDAGMSAGKFHDSLLSRPSLSQILLLKNACVQCKVQRSRILGPRAPGGSEFIAFAFLSPLRRKPAPCLLPRSRPAQRLKVPRDRKWHFIGRCRGTDGSGIAGVAAGTASWIDRTTHERATGESGDQIGALAASDVNRFIMSRGFPPRVHLLQKENCGR